MPLQPMAFSKKLVEKLAILLPFTSRCYQTEEEGEEALHAAFHRILPNSPEGLIVVGVDDDEKLLPAVKRLVSKNQNIVLLVLDRAALDRRASVAAHAQVVDLAASVDGTKRMEEDSRPTPICYIWEAMAMYAVNHHACTAFILLGDDIQISPSDWSRMIIGRSKQMTGRPGGSMDAS